MVHFGQKPFAADKVRARNRFAVRENEATQTRESGGGTLGVDQSHWNKDKKKSLHLDFSPCRVGMLWEYCMERLSLLHVQLGVDRMFLCYLCTSVAIDAQRGKQHLHLHSACLHLA